MKSSVQLLALILVLMGLSINSNAQAKAITLINADGKQSELDPRKLKAITIEALGHDQKLHRYTGPLLYDLLSDAGVKFGETAKKQTISGYVLIRAYDDYKCIFALAELDPLFNESSIIIAYEIDGEPFTETNGPFQIIVPREKKQGRWIRKVKSIEIKTTP